MGRKIVITSGKGGVGKTSVVAGLGVALARLGAHVCVMDTDIGLNNLDVMFGQETNVVYDIMDVVSGRARPRQALIEINECTGLSLLPSAHGYETKLITGQALKEIVNSVAETFDFVLLDCPAGIEAGFRRAVAAVDEALVVSTPHMTALRDADKVLSLLKSYELERVGLVINRIRGDLELAHENLRLEDIAELLCCDVVGAIPEDDNVSCRSGEELFSVETSSAGIAYRYLAEHVTGASNRLYDATEKYRGMFGRIKRKLRRIV